MKKNAFSLLSNFKTVGLLFVILMLGAPSILIAESSNASDENVAVDMQLQQLKQDVLALNRDLFILKEELLFPANTEVAIFLSLDVGAYFNLDAVEVEIDDKRVASHLYTTKQLDALKRGGVQRIYLGNVKAGSHEVIAVYTGRGPKGRDYRRAASLVFDKNTQPSYIELKIIDSENKMQPEFSIVSWQ
jgi:hypothetical protein